MGKNKILLLPTLFILVNCAAGANVETEKTQLQIREFQTKTYDTNDTKMVMKAIFNVLQDDGYIVQQAEPELGLLTATKETDIESGWEKFFATLGEGSRGRWSKNLIIAATANVSEFGDQTRVRVNFQAKKLDNQGGTLEIHQIEDEQFYRDFFSKVDKGIFIQKEKI